MKLFKSLLVAPATLGLLAPVAATANEVTISDFTPAEQLAITNSRVDGLEARLNNFEAGSFSETTTASFSADFAVGAVDGKGVTSTETDGDETLQSVYGFQIDLNTSFTGEDSLDISLDAGNGSSTGALSEFDLNGYGSTAADADKLVVDGVSYTFPLGSATAFVGDNTDGSMLFTTACVYGGPSNTLDDCANITAGITGGGVAVGASYDFDNGFTAAAGAQFTESGIATKGNDDSYALNLAYTADSYGVSVTYAMVEDSSGTTDDDDNFTAINAYYSFDNGLNISAGYEIGDLDNAAATADETEAYFLGINGEVGPGELGAAIGTYGKMTEASGNMPERMMYEAYYSYAVNDGMTITPLIYTVEGSDAADEDETGIMVKTSFSF
jgi:hypothetical protein